MTLWMAQTLFKSCLVLLFAGFFGVVSAAVTGQWVASILIILPTLGIGLLSAWLVTYAGKQNWDVEVARNKTAATPRRTR